MTQPNPNPPLTSDQTIQQLIVYSEVTAMRDAAVLLLALSPEDALAIAIYAVQSVGSYELPDGVKASPVADALMASAAFAFDGLKDTRYHRPTDGGDNPLARHDEDGQMLASEASDEAAWAESMVDAVLAHGLLPPNSMMLTVEAMLHYLARGHELRLDAPEDNRLNFPAPIAASDEVRGFAAVILNNFRTAMQALSSSEGAAH